MDLNKAYETLGLTPSASSDDVKKAFRKMAAKYHPDVCKEPDAEQKFKDINAANEFINNPKQDSGSSDGMWQWSSSGGTTAQFKTAVRRPPLIINAVLSFEESVLGCKKTFSVDKYVKCEECHGQCVKRTSDVCSVCKGKKQTTKRIGPMVVVTGCEACGGNGVKTIDCIGCQGEGSVKTNKTFEVKIPGGLHTGQKIQLSGGGHFTVNPMFGIGGYESAIIDIKVELDPDMKLVGNDVISTLEVSLLEALEGTSKTVRTIKGTNDIKIPKGSRHKEEIMLHGYGVPNCGGHIFVLDVKYPPIDELISAIKNIG